jgi:excisionase family DNA binding protein
MGQFLAGSPEQPKSLPRGLHEQLLTAAEASVDLRIHPVTLLRWAREGKIPHIRLDRRILFSSSRLTDWLSANYTESAVLTASTERKVAA